MNATSWISLKLIALLSLLMLPLTSPAIANGPVEQADLMEAETRRILVMVQQPPNRLRPGQSYSSGYGNSRSNSAKERLGRGLAGQYDLEFVELWPMPLIGLDCFVMELKQGVSVDAVIAEIEKNPRIKWAEPIEIYETYQDSQEEADPLYPISPAAREWDITRLHQQWTGRDVRVAVIDTQVDTSHPDLTGRIKLSRNFAPQSPPRPEYHGTEVAGIIAANANNGVGIIGVAPEAGIMALRACWQRGNGASSVCTSLNLARALNFAIKRKAEVINLSLGGPPNRLLSELIDTASDRGIAVVAAFDPNRPQGGFPASHSRVIAVSNRSILVDGGYNAPGDDIPTTQPGGGWHLVSGSSYSAAHISGLLALSYERARKARVPRRPLTSVSGSNREVDIEASFGR